MLQLQVTELPANGTECDETVNSFCAEDDNINNFYFNDNHHLEDIPSVSQNICRKQGDAESGLIGSHVKKSAAAGQKEQKGKQNFEQRLGAQHISHRQKNAVIGGKDPSFCLLHGVSRKPVLNIPG
ncbi:hypothetical protein EK904_000119 [Melospiza melodia maxima]|nr:hypothetical protein EK904_000119 [Melospiza melodia maxima]